MQRTTGFTLAELLVCLTLFSLLVGLGIPAFSETLRRNRLTVAANEFLTVVHFTRAEAIKRNGRVTLCKSPDGAACVEDGGWDRGWLVFIDADDDAQRDAEETVLRVGGKWRHGLSIMGNRPVARYLSYTGQGGSQTIGGGLQMGTISICAGGEARMIVIGSTGRPRVEAGTC